MSEINTLADLFDNIAAIGENASDLVRMGDGSDDVYEADSLEDVSDTEFSRLDSYINGIERDIKRIRQIHNQY